MVTFNQLITAFNRIADAHLQINSFGHGDLWEIATSGTINYPLMWVIERPNLLQKGKLTSNFSVLVMDLVNKDESNEDEVLSDTQLMCVDIVNELTHPDWDFDLNYERLNITLEPFTERFDDEVAGWKFDVAIELNYDRNRCAIPSDGVNRDFNSGAGSTPTTGYVTIYDLNGAVVTTVAAGGSYTIPCGLLAEGGNQLYAD